MGNAGKVFVGHERWSHSGMETNLTPEVNANGVYIIIFAGSRLQCDE